MKHRSVFTLICVTLVISACVTQSLPLTTPEAPIDMPNPASVHCADQGGTLEIRDEAGGQVGYCMFPDGSECEEWAFFRGECAPGGAEEEANIPSPTAEASAEVRQYDKGYRFEQNGWIYLHIKGEPYERGFQHGYLLAPELAEILDNFKDLTYWDAGKEWEFFVAQAVEQFAERIDSEYLDEIKGIAAGAQAAGTDISWQDVLTWNSYEELLGYWWPNELAGKYAQPTTTIAAPSSPQAQPPRTARSSWPTTRGMRSPTASSST